MLASDLGRIACIWKYPKITGPVLNQNITFVYSKNQGIQSNNIFYKFLLQIFGRIKETTRRNSTSDSLPVCTTGQEGTCRPLKKYTKFKMLCHPNSNIRHLEVSRLRISFDRQSRMMELQTQLEKKNKSQENPFQSTTWTVNSFTNVDVIVVITWEWVKIPPRLTVIKT